jgi:hypothetical protein
MHSFCAIYYEDCTKRSAVNLFTNLSANFWHISKQKIVLRQSPCENHLSSAVAYFLTTLSMKCIYMYMCICIYVCMYVCMWDLSSHIWFLSATTRICKESHDYETKQLTFFFFCFLFPTPSQNGALNILVVNYSVLFSALLRVLRILSRQERMVDVMGVRMAWHRNTTYAPTHV